MLSTFATGLADGGGVHLGGDNAGVFCIFCLEWVSPVVTVALRRGIVGKVGGF